MTAISAPGTALVGILNVTPDSFSGDGHHNDRQAAIEHAHRLSNDGADIVDIGGESTRPGATPLSAEEELTRVLSVVQGVCAAGIKVSIDTMHASTAVAAVEAGASVVNDVSGGTADPGMFAAIAAIDCQYVLGHMRGNPTKMAGLTSYSNLVDEVIAELMQQVECAISEGVASSRLVLDPGIGFAKTPQQNWEILRSFDRFTSLGFPIMVGVSRKRFLGELLPPEASVVSRDLPTAMLTALLVERGANAVRVHDVRSNRLALTTVRRLGRAL